jgi:hypothetical protein
MKLQILFDETLWGDLSNAYRLTCRPLMLVHEEGRPKVTWGPRRKSFYEKNCIDRLERTTKLC